MTPELLADYLRVIKDAQVMTFKVQIEGTSFEGYFQPPQPKETFGQEIQPGKWKEDRLDQVSELPE